jgi:hypothetical protein
MKNTMKTLSKMLGVALLFLLVTGCANGPKPLYNWGNYQSDVYARFKATSSPEQQIQSMEKTLQSPKSGLPIAPGFHAHLGLLYGEVGRRAEMYEQFQTEKRLFPESTVFMDFLLAKADKQKGNK